LNKVVDADRTNFIDLVAEVVNKYPSDYRDVVRLFYFCIETDEHASLHRPRFA